ncbi:MAG: hypothetical protein ACTSU2_12570, partial [Promethearchaeota archaeon]
WNTKSNNNNDSEMPRESSNMGLSQLKDLYDNMSLLPFNRAVSKYNIEDDIELDIVTSSRKIVDYRLNRLINITAIDQATRFLPLIGPAGSGKTHYYWVLKNRERIFYENLNNNNIDGININDNPFRVIYVSSPPTPYRLFHHIYSCLVDEIADEDFFLRIINIILEEIGIDPGKIDKSTNPYFLIAKLLPTFPGVFADCIKALVYLKIYNDNDIKGALALRWLLGETLTEEELKELRINSVLEQDDICLAMIKIITDLSGVVLIFYFDEMEAPYRTFGAEAQKRFFEYIKRLYNETRNSIIVTACLQDIWDEILKNADTPTLQRMEPELYLDLFNKNDLKVYYLRAMSRFWSLLNVVPPRDIYFPLNERILDEIYEKAGGNQRECIKLINANIEKAVDNLMNMQMHNQFGEQYSMNGLGAATTFIPTGVQGSNDLRSISQLENKMPQSQTRGANDKKVKDVCSGEDALNEGEVEEKQPIPGNIMEIFFKELKSEFILQNIDYELILDFSYTTQNKKKKLGALLQFKDKLLGIEVPSIKSFERSAGIAGFYALKRLCEAIQIGIIQNGILIVPAETNGQKFHSLLKQYPAVKLLKIKSSEAFKLVNSNTKELVNFRKCLKEILSEII